MTVTAIGASSSIQDASRFDPTHASQSGALLPLPDDMSDMDALGKLYALMSKDRQLGLEHSRQDIEHAKQLKKTEIAKAIAAIRQAREAREKGGFWGKLANRCLKVAKVAAVVGSVALAVGTAGAATPVAVLAIAGATMSTAAFVQGETHYLQKLGVSDTWSDRVEMGLTIGGGVCALGAGGLSLLSSPQDASQLAALGTKLSAGAGIVAGAAAAGAGVSHWQAAEADGEARDHEADAAKAHAEEARMQRWVLEILADVEASEKSDARTLGHLRGAIEARNEALVSSSLKV